MTPPPNVNDGSSRPPRLLVYGNEGAMAQLPQLPHDREWSFEESLDRLLEAEFDGMQADPSRADQVRKKALRFCAAARVNTPGEADESVRVRAASGADCITVHAGWGMEDDDEMDRLVGALLDASTRHDCPVYIETHRATIAQDIWRTCQLVKRIPAIRFNGDFSHFYCGQEMGYPGFDVSRKYLTPILERVSFIHGRISDGQCMQVDVGDGRDIVHAKNFRWLWRESMGNWLKSAAQGDIFLFVPELLPPSIGYSITYKDASGRIVEISDRWQQSLVLKRLAEKAFSSAT